MNGPSGRQLTESFYGAIGKMAQSDRLVGGILLGSALGAATALLWSSSGGQEDVTSSKTGENAAEVLAARRHLSSDGSLCAALQEPVLLFLSLDAPGTRRLLDDIDNLARVFAQLRQGDARPSQVSLALQARREANNRLHALIRKARQARPLLACELSEDFDELKRIMDGFVHNCVQQSSLNLMERGSPAV